ncbi:MAG: hypothetical protein AAB842_02455 [Patescibacteria group bacterium]
MLVDYSNSFKKEEKPILKQENHTSEKKKRFSLGGLKEYWFSYDKKIKIEIIILLAVVVVIFGVLIFYFSSVSKRKNIPSPDIIPFPSSYDKKMFPR